MFHQIMHLLKLQSMPLNVTEICFVIYMRVFFASPSSSSFRSTKEASEEYSRHNQAPIVELLGELVIGEEGKGEEASMGMVITTPVRRSSRHILTREHIVFLCDTFYYQSIL